VWCELRPQKKPVKTPSWRPGSPWFIPKPSSPGTVSLASATQRGDRPRQGLFLAPRAIIHRVDSGGWGRFRRSLTSGFRWQLGSPAWAARPALATGVGPVVVSRTKPLLTWMAGAVVHRAQEQKTTPSPPRALFFLRPPMDSVYLFPIRWSPPRGTRTHRWEKTPSDYVVRGLPLP